MILTLRDYIPQSVLNKFTDYFGEEKKLGVYIATAVAVYGTLKIVTYIKKQERRKKWNSVGKDVVVLHTLQRGKATPSNSPFVIKLEMYLKMAKIPYVMDFTEPYNGPKGKLPWITLNGEDMGDSQLIMEKLGKKFGKDFSSHLTPDQIGIAQAMRVMLEEHFFWCFAHWFFVSDKGKAFLSNMNHSLLNDAVYYPLVTKLFIIRTIKRITYAQGIGRHSLQEIEEMGQKDIAALSAWLGNKPFFMGDKPTEVDCAIFGTMALAVWVYPHSPYGKMLRTDYTNLVDYCHRVKETVWTDWNDCLAPH